MTWLYHSQESNTCSKSSLETQGKLKKYVNWQWNWNKIRHWHCSGALIVNLEHISLVFPLLSLNRANGLGKVYIMSKTSNCSLAQPLS